MEVPEEQICRVCGSESEKMVGIFTQEGDTNDLASKINNYLPITVSKNDSLPLNSCWDCVTLVLTWHELYETCMETDTKLRKIALGPPYEKDNTNEPHYEEINIQTKIEYSDNEPPPEENLTLSSFYPLAGGGQSPINEDLTILPSKWSNTNIDDDQANMELICIAPTVEEVSNDQVASQKSDNEMDTDEDKLPSLDPKENTTEKEITKVVYLLDNQQSKIAKNSNSILKSNVKVLTKPKNLNQLNVVSNTGIIEVVDHNLYTLQGNSIILERNCAPKDFNMRVLKIKKGPAKPKQLKTTEDNELENTSLLKEEVCIEENLPEDSENNLLKAENNLLEEENRLLKEEEMCEIEENTLPVHQFEEVFIQEKPVDKTKCMQRLIKTKTLKMRQILPKPDFVKPVRTYNRKKSSLLSLLLQNPEKTEVKNEVDVEINKEPSTSTTQNDLEIKEILKSESQFESVDNYINKIQESDNELLDNEEEVVENNVDNNLRFGKDKKAVRRRKYTKMDQLKIEEARMEVDGKIYYNCKECGKSLHSPYTFLWHTRIHTGERPFVCDLCGKQFRVSQGLVRHLRETHEGVKNYPCDICGRMFASKRNVEEHRRIHTNERPYVCDLCGKAFKQKASLFVHSRSHLTTYRYRCPHCNQGFRAKGPLLIHITKHTGEKPYACETCGRAFRIKYELKRHQMIHSDHKPWVCAHCGNSFRQKRYLKSHLKINHGITI